MSKTTKDEFLEKLETAAKRWGESYWARAMDPERCEAETRNLSELLWNSRELAEEAEREKESRTGACRWCGQTYENHSDNGPATRMPCLGHKNGFVKAEGEKSNQSKGPTP